MRQYELPEVKYVRMRLSLEYPVAFYENERFFTACMKLFLGPYPEPD
jgi:hypothetical protein